MSGLGLFLKIVNRSITLLFLQEIPFLVFEYASSMPYCFYRIQICVLDSELPCNRNIESRRLLLTLFFHEQGRSSLRRFSTHASLLE